MPLTEYQVICRHLPMEHKHTPNVYRMRIFALNKVVAKSRFWYSLRYVLYGIYAQIPPNPPPSSPASLAPDTRFMLRVGN